MLKMAICSVFSVQLGVFLVIIADDRVNSSS